MSEYVIITDSASDITDIQEKEWNTPVIKMTYLVNDTLYVNQPSHSEFPLKEFYATVKAGAKCSTSAINSDTFAEFFTPYLEEGNDIIYVCFSSALSATYQNALNASTELAEKFPQRRIAVIDSLCASFGQGFLVYLCSEKRNSGASFEETVAYTEEIKHRLCHEFTVDDLGQLKRGGRISPTAAFFGSLIQIKPMLFVTKEGRLASYDKVRGRRISLRKLADMVIGEANDDGLPIFISHSDCEDEANELAAMIKEKLPNRKYFINYIGPVIGCHCGHKTIAAYCISESRGDARLKK